MLEALTSRLDAIFKKLRGRGLLTEENIAEALREVRLALLEADVHFGVVRDFIERIKGKALGREVLESLTPGQQMVKIVWSELCVLLGENQSRLQLASEPPTVLMLVGLQGSGKTTTAGKLARYFKKEGKRVLLVAADLQRPAAADQLEILSKQAGVGIFRRHGEGTPVGICSDALQAAQDQLADVVILDTAGRLHVDETLMAELREIKGRTSPHEVLFVADSMTGQDAVNVAGQFSRQVGLTGVILTKAEGDAKGGAVLSIKAATGCPIKFIGVGEKLDALEVFHPDRMASRILGMGDVLSLVERAEQAYSKKEAEALSKKMVSNAFTLEDFKDQLSQVKKLGSLEELMGMIPGGSRLMGKMGGGVPEKEIRRVEAIINSMTPKERRDYTIINGSRRKRIARGSGTTVQDINRLLKQFLQARKVVKAMTSGGKRSDIVRQLMS